MRKLGFALVALAVLAVSAPAADDARVLIQKAQVTAAKEEKTVLIMFHASWCGWCKRFEKILALQEIKPLIDKAYVIVPITVMESDPKFVPDMNPNGMEIMKEVGGENQGIPYFAALDQKGKVIMNSKRPIEGKDAANVGCPATPEEIAYFMNFLEKTAPKITAAERDLIAKKLAEK